MEIFIARQPIFDTRKNVYAYEMLYRGSQDNTFAGANADMASASVIINTFQSFGLDVLTNGKPVFINFTESLLRQEIATIIPHESLIIELLETVKPTQETIERCKLLKSKGYILALDDFVYRPEFEPLIRLADIIKVDFISSTKQQIEELVSRLGNRNVIFLAEKIETYEEFEYAKSLGFLLFQGFFFSKPEMVTGKAIPPLKTTYLQLMSKLKQEEMEFGEFAKTISLDLSLIYSLLRMVNSAAFGFRRKIRSVKHALVMLGEKEIRKWVALMLLHDLGRNQPEELVKLSLIRARFAELIALKTKFKHQSDNLFLAGLFSLLDAILGRSLIEVLQDVQTPDVVQECLLDEDNEISGIYCILVAYEQGRWEDVTVYAGRLNLDYRELAGDYLAALSWYNELIGG